ncbi:LOW QUALITY PROTEIN: uncharacterized protein [Panulirus ornatus]|uniref:LOW QUALITY PROTEIN: uncharacterized protein n=1 Tax=Panulirus ornatus TaxID=150431 RepID=UPI003A88ABA0
METNTSCIGELNSTWCRDEIQEDVVNSSVGVGVVVGGSNGVPIPEDGRSPRDWPKIRQELQWAFPVHIYGFACLFFMLAFYTFFSILNLRSQISNRPFMSTINVFLCVLGVTRAACFLIDPYTLGQVMPGFLGSVMWDVGYPCILSAFSLIQLAFSQLTQVKFRPETLRRKSALSLVITTHFALVLGSDIVTAFESHLQVVRWVVQTVFLSWGLVLCVTFLYGGARIIRLLRTIPHTAFQGNESCPQNNKGILQLALLAQCNNIASSVLTAAAPSLLTPKIKITDEFDHTYSYGSEGSRVPSLPSSDLDSAPPARRTMSRASVGSEVAAMAAVPSTSGTRTFEVETSDITEESEDQDSVKTPSEERTGVSKSGRTSVDTCSSSRTPADTCSSGRTPVDTCSSGRTDISTLPSGDEEEARDRTKGTNSQSTNLANIIIRVEDVGNGDVCDDVGEGNGVVDTPAMEEQGGGVYRDRGSTQGSGSVDARGNRDACSEVTVQGVIHSAPSVKSINAISKSDAPSEETTKASGDVMRKRSFSEGVNDRSDVRPVIKSEENEKCLKIGNGDDIVPKRKKSLTWSEDTQNIEGHEKDRESKKVSDHESNERIVREPCRRASTSSRRSSRSVEKVKVRHTRSYELGDAPSRRRSSTVSSCSARKGSENWQALPGPYHREHRSLSSSSPAGTRRSSRKSIRDEAEVEALLARSPEGRSDVTLSSILNHIAYVNQTATTAKLSSSVKDSRKAQVQQVLVVTYVTAALGTLLSLALVYGLYGHFSSLALLPRLPWLWFTYESSCRFLEFLMGCAMANITRQPVNRHPQYPYSLRLKQRNSIYM